MEKRKIKFKRRIGIRNGNLGLSFPKELAEYLDLSPGESVMIVADSGKYGNFLSIYRYDTSIKKEEDYDKILIDGDRNDNETTIIPSDSSSAQGI